MPFLSLSYNSHTHTLSFWVDRPTDATTCFNRLTPIKSSVAFDYIGRKFSYFAPSVSRCNSADAIYMARRFSLRSFEAELHSRNYVIITSAVSFY